MIAAKKITGFARVKTEIRNADGTRAGGRDFTHNLIFDGGLNALANRAGFAGIFATCKIGSSNAANSVPTPGGVTLSQTAFTVTANAGFFNSGMVGGLIKYGTGTAGAEYYITSYASPTSVTVDTSATVAPTNGTVWLVQQSQLGAYLFKSTAYDPSAGGCGYSFAGTDTIILHRRFYFAAQGSPYSVNEIGYTDNNNNDGTCQGRVVLPGTDTIGVTQYYLVTIAFTFTVAPAVPTAFANVGTNIDVSGSGTFNFWDCQIVRPSDGATDYYQPVANGFPFGVGYMDASNNSFNSIGLLTAPVSLPANPSTAGQGYSSPAFVINPGAFANSGGVGVALCSGAFSFVTAGQTLYGFVIGGDAGNPAIVADSFLYSLTTPIVLPNGIFSGSCSLKTIFARVLSN